MFWKFDYNHATHMGFITLGIQPNEGNDVPEPATWGMLLAGVVGLLL